MRLTTQGIVLRETNYKEADKILTVLTRDWGKRTVKARGCRRKNSKLTAASQLLVYSELTLSERGEFTTLTEADPLEQFWSVRQDLETLALALGETLYGGRPTAPLPREAARCIRQSFRRALRRYRRQRLRAWLAARRRGAVKSAD